MISNRTKVLGKNEMFLGEGIFSIFNTIRVFPTTGICHLSSISGSVTGLATHTCSVCVCVCVCVCGHAEFFI